MKICNYCFVISLIVLFSFQSNGQTLVDKMKNKNYGTYVGEIPPYSFESDTLVIRAFSTSMEVHISKTGLEMIIGSLSKKGGYAILFKAENYYLLEGYFDGEIKPERLLVNFKDHTVLREGTYPQPNAMLRKVKSKKKGNKKGDK